MNLPRKQLQHNDTDVPLSLLYLLQDKEGRQLSWREWSDEHRAFGLGAHQRDISDAARAALERWPIAKQLVEVEAAALPLRDHLKLYLELYQQRHRIHVSACAPRRVLLLKFSADGRRLAGPNEALFYQLLSVHHPQSPSHVVTHCIARLLENDTTLATVYCQSGLVELLHEFNARPWLLRWSTHRTEELPLEYIYVTDWMAIVAQLALERPNAAQESSLCCWLCRRTKPHIKEGWRATPFEFIRIERTHADFSDPGLCTDYPMASAVCLERRRYCWAHAFARLLTNLLGSLADLMKQSKNSDAPAEHLAALVAKHSSRSKWTAASSLSIKEAKLLLNSPQFHHAVGELFRGHSVLKRVFVPSPDGHVQETRELESETVVLMLLACVVVIKDFAYAQWPSRHSFAVLWRARNALLGIYAASDLPLAATEHFLFNHAIELALHDRTAYVTLQEGMEHKHKVDRDDASHSSHNHKRTHNNPRTFFEQILDHQELRRVLDIVDETVNQRDYSAERLTNIPLPAELAQWPDMRWPSVFQKIVNEIPEK